MHEQEKQKMQHVLEVFDDYLTQSPYLEILFSQKLDRFIPLQIEDGEVCEAYPIIAFQTGEELCEYLLNEIRKDFETLSHRDKCFEGRYTEEETAELRARFSVYLSRLPEYASVGDRFFEQSIPTEMR